MGRKRFYIYGYDDGREVYLTNKGWVPEYSKRGLYSYSAARIEQRKAINRNALLDPEDRIQLIVLVESQVKEEAK